MKIAKAYDNVRTVRQWAERGFVAKEGVTPTTMWTNGYCQQQSKYLYASDVEENAEASAKILEDLHQEKLGRAREKRAEERRKREEEKARMKKNAQDWADFLVSNPLIIIYDTETSGLYTAKNDILSLSWQLVDASKGFAVIEEKTCYFPFPDDPNRVSEEAIEINGLSKEELERLGTMPRKDGLRLFLKALQRANVAVAHNNAFDNGFIKSACAAQGLKEPKFKHPFDTMKETTYFCAIPSYYGDGYKWPRLSELAECLEIDDEDIDYHKSSSDVELTKRCFVEIIKRGIVDA